MSLGEQERGPGCSVYQLPVWRLNMILACCIGRWLLPVERVAGWHGGELVWAMCLPSPLIGVWRETWVPGMPLSGAALQPWGRPAWVGVCGSLPGGLSRQTTGWWGRGERWGWSPGAGRLLKWKENPFVAKCQACVSSHSVLQEQ